MHMCTRTHMHIHNTHRYMEDIPSRLMYAYTQQSQHEADEWVEHQPHLKAGPNTEFQLPDLGAAR